MKLSHVRGVEAENDALVFLQNRGLHLLDRRWHCVYGEIDLIMQEKDTIVFVEVKYRSDSLFGGAMYAVTPQKCIKLMKTAALYLQRRKIQAPCRIDAFLYQGQNTPVWLKNILG